MTFRFTALVCLSIFLNFVPNIYAQITFVDSTALLTTESVFSGVAVGIADMNGDGLDDRIRLDDGRDLIIEYQNPVGGNFTSLNYGLVANNTGTNFSPAEIGGPSIFLQGINFANINNDGNIAIFACHDDDISSPNVGDGNGGFTHNLCLINTASPRPSDNSGNYGTVWTDYDSDGDLVLYLSKYRICATDPNDGSV